MLRDQPLAEAGAKMGAQGKNAKKKEKRRRHASSRKISREAAATAVEGRPQPRRDTARSGTR
jgi:hypothetical protein